MGHASVATYLVRTALPVGALLALLFAVTPARAELGLVGEHRVLQSQAGGAIEVGDYFGAALAAGDFDGDGFADLAIGVPQEAPGAVMFAGTVLVVYGTASGLNGVGARAPQTVNQDQPGVADVVEADDLFGITLAVGNFNADLYDDLAVGIIGEDAGRGAVQVFYGSSGGLDLAGDDYWVNPGAEVDWAGWALATGRWNADAFDDLVIGVPGLDISGPDTGLIVIFPGTASGLDFDAELGAAGFASGGRFGSAVGVGHVNDDGGNAELIVGAPFADDEGPAEEGVLYILDVTTGSVDGQESMARLGTSVVVDDFYGAGFSQVVVGVPGRTAFGQNGAGSAILVLPGWGIELAQGFNGLPETAEPGDRFGEVLGSGDFDADGRADLVIGVPSEDVDSVTNAGVVQIIYGDAFDLGVSHWQVFGAAEFGDPAGSFDRLGAAVAAGDFNGDGADDLAIGAPGTSVNGQNNTGVVQVLYSALLFRDGFESGDLTAWSE